MKLHVFGLLAVLAVGGMLTAQPGDKAPSNNGDDALEKKIKELRDQIDELNRKQQALEKEQKLLLDKKYEKERLAQERKAKEDAERQAKEAAEKKKHFARVEIRGKLVITYHGHNNPSTWQVVINDLTWNLNFGDKKELKASAEKLAGKGVVITGVVANKKASLPFPIYPQPNPPGWPPGWPNPNPGGPFPGAFPMQSHYVDPPPTITVESLTAAKD